MALIALLFGLGLLLPLIGDFGSSSDTEDDMPSGESVVADETMPVSDLLEEPEALDRYTSGDADGDGFNIDLALYDEWTDTQLDAIFEAAEYLSDLIVEDITDARDDDTGERIDDLLLHIRAESFASGPFGGIIGQAENTQVRSDSGLTVVAELTISPDLDDETFRATVLHEMIHALGLGNEVFTDQARFDSQGQPRFIGENAMQAYEDDFPRAFRDDPRADEGVPLDANGFHWSEDVFGDELLTAFDTTGTARLGSITVAALEDIGYDTLWDDVTVAGDAVGRFDLPVFRGPAFS